MRMDGGRDHGINLVCPLCRAELEWSGDGGCRCLDCGAVFPKRAEVAVFLSDHEWAECRARLDAERKVLEQYESARRAAPLTVQYFDWWVRRMLREVPDCGDRPLVELMCGGAEICRRLPGRFPAAFGLDSNVDMVERAARDFAAAGETRVTLACGTAARLPLPDQCTGAVIVQGALHHARPVLPRILAEIHRILVPGGVFVGSEPANDHLLTRAVREWQYRRSHAQGNDPEEEGFARRELRGLLAEAGLRLDRYEQFGFIAYPLMGNTDLLPLLAATKSMRLGRALLKLDEVLERVPIIRSMAWASLFQASKDG